VSSAPHRVFRLLVLVWVGSALTIGYIVAPTLFAMLERSMAGDVAARLFRIEAFLGVACGILSLALANMLVRRGAAGYRRLRWFVAGMLVCVLIGYFGLQPFMEGLREAARSAGLDLAHSAYAARFGLLHGISTLLYVVETLLGVVLVWMLPEPAAPVRGAGQAGMTA
jgi:glucan phosphoethanolaminetransferase (alkaline phosphatase superfamily)